MCLTYKILSDSDKQFSEQWFERAANRRTTRMAAATNNLVPKRGNHDYRRGFFSLRSHRHVEPPARCGKSGTNSRCLQAPIPPTFTSLSCAETCSIRVRNTQKNATTSTDILTICLPGLPRINTQVYQVSTGTIQDLDVETYHICIEEAQAPQPDRTDVNSCVIAKGPWGMLMHFSR
jgi:hypothetical protein